MEHKGKIKSPDEVIVPAPPEPWYKKVPVGKTWQSWVLYATIFVLLLLGGLIVYERTHQRPVETKAVAGTARFSIQPVNQNIPPISQFQIWMTADQPVAFVQFEVVFNPQLVNLTQEFNWVNTALTRVVRITPMAEANTTGKIFVSVALDPSKRDAPPTGTIQLGTISLEPNTTLNNQTGTVSFTTNAFQVVNPDTTLFTVTGTGATVGVNVTPTPTPLPTSTPTPTLTPAPTIPQPTPNTNDTTPPVVTITSPADGSTVPTKGSVRVRSSASDASGIFKIEILLDTQVMATCNVRTSCSSNINVNRFTVGSHTITVRATDNSANRNVATRTITVTKP